MRFTKTGVAFALFVSAAAYAGTPDLVGGWSGEGLSLLPDGTTATSLITLCVEKQEGGLFSGMGVSLNTYADGSVRPQLLCGTGHIATDKRVTAAFTPPPGYAPIPLMALFDGKWTGRGISGVVRDPSDGGTSEIQFSLDPGVACPLSLGGGAPFISEIHYDDTGTDDDEAIEVTGAAGLDLTDYRLVLYNGNGGVFYDDIALTGTIADYGDGQGVVVVELPLNGLQNGSPDGIALVDSAGTVHEFLSYEGSFVAADGPAEGITSMDIGVEEPFNTAEGDSLQLIVGAIWTGPRPNTFGRPNFTCVAVDN